MERAAPPEVMSNWRFQQGLFRAYYDAYIRRRLIHETELEREARERLSRAEELGADAALREALEILSRPDREKVGEHLRERIEELGEALFQSCGMQLSVERYGAAGPERGAVLDFLDVPLNDRVWLEGEISKLRSEADEGAKLRGIGRILNWENPGPGGFYDNLGSGYDEPHLIREPGWEADPGFVESAQDEFSFKFTGRLSWQCQAQTLRRVPLKVRYDGLDPESKYRIRLTYCGRFGAVMKLIANGRYLIHDAVGPEDPPRPVEFDVPQEATREGTLELSWRIVEGRGCQVAEIWLIREGDHP